MSTLMSFTVGTKDFRQALRSVTPHASRDDTLPMINRVRCYVDGENVTVAATDRFTAALGLVSVWETSSDVVAPIDLALSDVAMILSVFTVAREASEDSPEWQLRIELRDKTTHTPGTDPDVSSLVVRIADVSGLITGEVLEFPAMPPHSGFPDLPQLFANQLAKPAGLLDTFGINSELLVRLKTAGKVYGNKPLVLSTPGAERSPILARCGDSFLGLVMPTFIDEDQHALHKGWLDGWVRRLPLPSTQRVVDLDEVRWFANRANATEFLREAARLVISTQFGSPAMLQRRLGISFAAAQTILDDLARRDIVTYVDEDNKSAARTVRIPVGDLTACLDTLTADDPAEEASDE